MLQTNPVHRVLRLGMCSFQMLPCHVLPFKAAAHPCQYTYLILSHLLFSEICLALLVLVCTLACS